MAGESERWVHLTLARADGSAGDPALIRASLMGIIGPLTTENAERFPRARIALTLVNGSFLALEETLEELASQLAGGH